MDPITPDTTEDEIHEHAQAKAETILTDTLYSHEDTEIIKTHLTTGDIDITIHSFHRKLNHSIRS